MRGQRGWALLEAGGGAGRKIPDTAQPGLASRGREFTDHKNAALGFKNAASGLKSSWCFSVEELGWNSRQRSVLVSFGTRIFPEIKAGGSPPKGDSILSFISSKNNPNQFS